MAAPAPRQEVSLNGDWESRRVEELTAPPAGGTWTPCRVPGYLRGHDYERAWLRRSFAVPEAMKGQRIKLHFGGVKYNCRVLVNGKPIGGCFGGYQPFEVDVTDAIHFGKPNELAVGCHDWTGIFTPGERVNFQRDGWARVRGIPHDRVLAPIGGLYGLYGIWDDVTLRSHPAVHVKDLFIKTSVRRGELSVEFTLKHDSRDAVQVTLRAAVEQKGRDVLQLMPSTVDIPAGKTAKITISQRWPKPHLWSHVDPHLYHLRTELSSGDVLRTRFGFREFWVEGHRFYLNGVPVNPLYAQGYRSLGCGPCTKIAQGADERAGRWIGTSKCGGECGIHTKPLLDYQI